MLFSDYFSDFDVSSVVDINSIEQQDEEHIIKVRTAIVRKQSNSTELLCYISMFYLVSNVTMFLFL